MRTAFAAVCVLVLSSSALADSLDKEAIRRPIRRELPKITQCYEKQLNANPKLGDGDISVDFLIGKTGQVIDATASGFDAAVGSCVAKVFRGIQFPRPPSEVRVAYPFHFSR
jgi:hypothetical protein